MTPSPKTQALEALIEAHATELKLPTVKRRFRQMAAEATREHAKIRRVISSLFDHYCAHPEDIPASIPPGDLPRRVTDYLAGMTDRFCIRRFEALSVPVAFAP